MKIALKNIIKNYFLLNSGIQRHIVLAEFPKCGGTFLHSILNTLIVRKNNEVNYSNISTFSNGMDLDMIKPLSYKSVIDNYSKKPIVIKTHKNWFPSFKKIICLYRDPVDVFKSLYNMKKSYFNENISFSNFIRGKRGVKSYINFYQSYLNAPQHVRIMFVDYKDVINNKEVIKDIMYFTFGLLIEDQIIEKIINYNNKENAIKDEILYTKYDLRKKLNPNIKFINNEKFNNEIDKTDIRYIKDETKEISNILGLR